MKLRQWLWPTLFVVMGLAATGQWLRNETLRERIEDQTSIIKDLITDIRDPHSEDWRERMTAEFWDSVGVLNELRDSVETLRELREARR